VKRARRQRAEEELEIIKAKQAVEEFAKIEYGVSATKVPERPKEKILTPEDGTYRPRRSALSDTQSSAAHRSCFPVPRHLWPTQSRRAMTPRKRA